MFFPSYFLSPVTLREEKLKATERMKELDTLINDLQVFEDQLSGTKKQDTDIAKEIVKSMALALGGSGKKYSYKPLGYPGDPNRSRKKNH